MPWPDFSELSFGYGFLREFERLHMAGGTFSAAPDFISQASEATKGYDVSVLDNSTPVFFQFKRSFVLATANATEIKKGDFSSLPLYRMHIRERDAYRQHRALQELEDSGESVFYVTSQIPDLDSMSRCYLSSKVLTHATAVVSPNEIVLPDLHEKHHITFEAGGQDFVVYSKEGRRLERQFSDWKQLTEKLSLRRRSVDGNRGNLKKALGLLQAQSRDARRVADKFEDPVIQVAVLALLVLDAHLTFYKE